MTTKDSAFLSIDLQTFNHMGNFDGGSQNIRGASPHKMGDQDLLWELFERHYFVKSVIRLEENLINKMPELREEDQDRR